MDSQDRFSSKEDCDELFEEILEFLADLGLENPDLIDELEQQNPS